MRADDQLPSEAQRKTLEERALRLAQQAASTASASSAIELLHFDLAGERYALETSLVLGVVRAAQSRRVPGAPQSFAGVINLHGEVLPVADLSALFGLAPRADAAGNAVILGRERPDLAVLVDVATGIETHDAALLGEQVQRRSEDPIVRGVLPGGVTVIDGDALLRDPRLLIQDTSILTGEEPT